MCSAVCQHIGLWPTARHFPKTKRLASAAAKAKAIQMIQSEPKLGSQGRRNVTWKYPCAWEDEELLLLLLLLDAMLL